MEYFIRKMQYEDLEEVMQARADLEYFRIMAEKHTFDGMGKHFRSMIETQSKYLKRIETQYYEQY